MVWHLDIPISTFTIFSMLMLGLTLFRISVKMKWPLVLLVSLFISSLFGLLFTLLHTETWNPMLVIVTEAIFIHYLFRLRKLHSLMVAFLGSLGYTIYLAVVLFAAPYITHIPLRDYFEELDSSYWALKIIAASLSCLTALVLVKRRLGFTVRLEMNTKNVWRPKNNVLLHVFLFAFLLFSLTYYAVTLKLTSIFYFVASFCILMVWIIYLLYRKEMEDI
jgi:hypothetical protein